MKSIKNKILTPFLIMLIIIPLLSTLVFNIAIRFYLNKRTQNELINTANGIETLLKSEVLNSAANGDLTDITIHEKLSLIRGVLKVSKLVSDTEFVFLTKNSTIIFPQNFERNFLNENIVKEADNRINKTNNNPVNNVVSFRINRVNYFALEKTYEIDGRPANIRNNSINIIFIATTKNSGGVIFVINIILFVILLSGITISSFIALKVSNSIAKPIFKLNDYSKQIGKGDYIEIPHDDSSLEISELTKALNDMSTSLKQKESVRNLFLQNSSHELRTPLMSIGGYAEGIINGVFSDNVKAAEVIQSESKRLTSLVDELLNLSRIENKTDNSDFIEYNLPDLITEFSNKLKGYALQQNKQINIMIEKEFIPVKIDEVLLMQAVNNVISNCIKYAKSVVTVRVTSNTTKASVIISDDGDGFSPSDLPHIFERFYKGKNGNFGLGLSIAKSAIEFLGGNISAYNNKGAVFEIDLPIS